MALLSIDGGNCPVAPDAAGLLLSIIDSYAESAALRNWIGKRKLPSIGVLQLTVLQLVPVRTEHVAEEYNARVTIAAA